jgi:hypothetical protein
VLEAQAVCLECLSPSERKALERDLETAARVQSALLPPRQLAHDDWEVSLLSSSPAPHEGTTSPCWPCAAWPEARGCGETRAI